ncbi:MAG: hypothetical protein WCD51_13465, partial [Anaerolineae bacterium]
MKRLRPLGFLFVLCATALLAVTVSSSAPDMLSDAAPVEAAERPAPGSARADGIGYGAMAAPSLTDRLQGSGSMIIDHTCTDLSQVPDFWIEQAKALLRVSYGHTSHGSQPITGMEVLEASTPGGLYDFITNGAVTPGVLSLADSTPSGDLGDSDWATRTGTYLDGPGGNRNVVVWSWCGQVSGATQADIESYLDLMNGLEQDYPDVTFVYMTVHLDRGGVEGNLNQRNEQIRQ